MGQDALSQAELALLAWMPLSVRHVWLRDDNPALARAYLARNPQAVVTRLSQDCAARQQPPDLIAGTGGLDLPRLAPRLAATGAAVWTVENPACWRNLMNLGADAQAEAMRSALKLRDAESSALTAAGLRLQKLRIQAAPPPTGMEAGIEVVPPHLAGVPQDVVQKLLWIARFVFCAMPQATAPELLRVHYLVKVPKFMIPRTEVPGRALAAEPRVLFSSSTGEGIPPHLPPEVPKVMVVQRARFPDPAAAGPAMARLMATGWVVVTEFDDDPELVAQVLKVPVGQFTTQFQAAHAVQTSTAHLQARMRCWNPEVGLLPNTVAALPPLAARAPGPMRVFYGALNRGRFAVNVAASLAPAIRRHPEAEFLVAHDRPFFEALPTTRKRFLGTLDYPAYLRALTAADIALMPLEGRAEELGKSDLKHIEAASVATLTIASPAVYGASVHHGQTGLIAPALSDWAAALAVALDDPARARAMALAARDEVASSRLIAHHVGPVRDWYLDLWLRREELTRAAAARVPALADELSRLGQNLGGTDGSA